MMQHIFNTHQVFVLCAIATLVRFARTLCSLAPHCIVAVCVCISVALCLFFPFLSASCTFNNSCRFALGELCATARNVLNFHSTLVWFRIKFQFRIQIIKFQTFHKNETGGTRASVSHLKPLFQSFRAFNKTQPMYNSW